MGHMMRNDGFWSGLAGFLSNLFLLLGLALFALVMAKAFDLIKTASGSGPLSLVLPLAYLVLCFVLFLILAFLAIIVYLVSYRLKTGARALPTLGATSRDESGPGSFKRMVKEAVVVAQSSPGPRLARWVLAHLVPLALFELEIERLRECLQSNEYSKNRIGIYAYDALRDTRLKEPAECCLSRLAGLYPNHDDPDHLIEIGKRAGLQLPE